MSKPLSILIVDDNLNFVSRLVSMIRDASEVEYLQIAENYQEASRILDEEAPDVALLDINLPGKNGMAILSMLKQKAPDCVAIMITNHADDYYRQQCLELGAHHFLDKTIEFARVTNIIKEISYRKTG